MSLPFYSLPEKIKPLLFNVIVKIIHRKSEKGLETSEHGNEDNAARKYVQRCHFIAFRVLNIQSLVRLGPEYIPRQFRLIRFYGVAEVCKFHDMIIVLDQDILRLYVSVKDFLIVYMLYCLNQFLEVEPPILLIQNSAAIKQVV